MKMKEDEIQFDFYQNHKGEWEVNIGHKTYAEGITMSLYQAMKLSKDLAKAIEEEWEWMQS